MKTKREQQRDISAFYIYCLALVSLWQNIKNQYKTGYIAYQKKKKNYIVYIDYRIWAKEKDPDNSM